LLTGPGARGRGAEVAAAAVPEPEVELQTPGKHSDVGDRITHGCDASVLCEINCCRQRENVLFFSALL